MPSGAWVSRAPTPWDPGGVSVVGSFSRKPGSSDSDRAPRCPGHRGRRLDASLLPHDTQSGRLVFSQTIDHCPCLVGRSAACPGHCQTWSRSPRNPPQHRRLLGPGREGGLGLQRQPCVTGPSAQGLVPPHIKGRQVRTTSLSRRPQLNSLRCPQMSPSASACFCVYPHKYVTTFPTTLQRTEQATACS